MVNQCILVGRVEAITFRQTRSNVVLSIKTYNNKRKEYNNQRIPVTIDNSLIEAIGKLETKTFVGVKGQLHSRKGSLTVKAEKLTFVGKRQEGSTHE